MDAHVRRFGRDLYQIQYVEKARESGRGVWYVCAVREWSLVHRLRLGRGGLAACPLWAMRAGRWLLEYMSSRVMCRWYPMPL